MSNIRVLEKTSDVKETLQMALDLADETEGVIVIRLNKDGSQSLRTSTMTADQKAFLFAFHQASIVSWFRLGDEP